MTLESGMTRRDLFKATAAVAATATAGGIFGPMQAFASEAASEDDTPLANPIDPEGVPDKWDAEAEFVVVGTGGGGLSSSVYLANAGHSVITVEKLSTSGGSTKHATVFVCYGGSRHQVEAGYSTYGLPYDPRKPAMEFWKAGQYTADLKTLIAIMDAAPRCVDFMEDMGVQWGMIPSNQEVGGKIVPVAASLVIVAAEAMKDAFFPQSNKFLVDHMEEAGRQRGVDFRFGVKCETLIKDDSGRIVGIKTEDLDGGVAYIHATGGVILAAGGFTNNRDMLKKYCPTAYKGAASAFLMPCDTGEGVRMGLGAGADIAGYDSWQGYCGGLDWYAYGEGGWHHYLYSGDNQLSRQPWLQFDRSGERYPWRRFDATSGDFAALNEQAGIEATRVGGRGYQIFDSDYETNIWKIVQLGCRLPLNPDMAGIERMPEYYAPHDWRIGVKHALDHGVIKKADTLEELASLLELEPSVVVNAVENWNKICDSGVDHEYDYDPAWLNPVVKPPFYGIRVGAQLNATGCGLRVNQKFQVLDPEGSVMPGLYAVAATAGGIHGIGSQSMANTPGGVIGLAALSWTTGFIIAENIVADNA